MSPILVHLLFKYDQARDVIDRRILQEFPIGCRIAWTHNASAISEQTGTVQAHVGGYGPERRLQTLNESTGRTVEVRIRQGLRRLS